MEINQDTRIAKDLAGHVRRSQDKTINSEGQKLLRLCEEMGIYIANGCAEGDKTGGITFVGGCKENCVSVLDLILCIGPKALTTIKKLQVEARPESDHLPISIILRGK